MGTRVAGGVGKCRAIISPCCRCGVLTCANARRPLQGLRVATVDNPHVTAGQLREMLPDAEIKMDVGHVLFSRLCKHLDKQHSLCSK